MRETQLKSYTIYEKTGAVDAIAEGYKRGLEGELEDRGLSK